MAGEPLAHGLSVSTFVEVRKVRLLIAEVLKISLIGKEPSRVAMVSVGSER
jgi:hypothetical protein